MLYALYPFGILKAYAATQQERSIAFIAIKYRPVKLFATSTMAHTFCIEYKHIDNSIILATSIKIFCRCYAYCLEDFYLWTYIRNKRCLKVTDKCRSLRTVKLYGIKTEVYHMGDNVLNGGIDKHSHLIYICTSVWLFLFVDTT